MMLDLPPDMLEYRFLMFPILHRNTGKTRGVDHWTLLVFDQLNGDFNYYNSMLPRRSIADPYLKSAKEIVRYMLCILVFNVHQRVRSELDFFAARSILHDWEACRDRIAI